ncbi:uncharacterized protein EI90DRAFT_3072860 [Cantharellus anzutake]|uniref:uncharacterized protein n=1 Tax=Cantharellus anzutake TaxID=1750568 RepID=UPI001906D72C|nr:uncharacterized protein EI90DRAFT_3072860 [Cantharellus anzutake]KAF8325438.1 hypothetical protein EI90DRAFT_3072860 [Cantharellus anzutake]
MSSSISQPCRGGMKFFGCNHWCNVVHAAGFVHWSCRFTSYRHVLQHPNHGLPLDGFNSRYQPSAVVPSLNNNGISPVRPQVSTSSMQLDWGTRHRSTVSCHHLVPLKSSSNAYMPADYWRYWRPLSFTPTSERATGSSVCDRLSVANVLHSLLLPQVEHCLPVCTITILMT